MANNPSIGLIIPSSNRLTEPQFNAYVPPGIGVHVTRLRMTGPAFRTRREVSQKSSKPIGVGPLLCSVGAPLARTCMKKLCRLRVSHLFENKQ